MATNEAIDAEILGELGMLSDESTQRVKVSFKKLGRSLRYHRRRNRKVRKAKPMTDLVPVAGAAREVDEQETGQVEKIEASGLGLARYIIDQVATMAAFLEREEGRPRRKGQTDLDVLDKLANTTELVELVSRFEIQAQRLIAEELSGDEGGSMLDWAEKALAIMEAQDRHHSVGGVDFRQHKEVRLGLAGAVERGASRKALKELVSGRQQDLGLEE